MKSILLIGLGRYGKHPATIAECTKAGANVFVVGTAAFKAENMTEAVGSLIRIAEEAAE